MAESCDLDDPTSFDEETLVLWLADVKNVALSIITARIAAGEGSYGPDIPYDQIMTDARQIVTEVNRRAVGILGATLTASQADRGAILEEGETDPQVTG